MKIQVNIDEINKEIGDNRFVEAEHRKGAASVVDGSEEVVLNFTNGKEISIFFDGNKIVVEAD